MTSSNAEAIKIFEAKASRNIANLDELDKFIAGLVDRVNPDTPNRDNIIKWLKKNFRKWMINSYPNVEKLTKAREGLPDWIIDKAAGDVQGFLSANEIYWIQPSPEFEDEMAHVVDYLSTTPSGRDLSKWDVPNVLEKAKNWGHGDEDEDGAVDDEFNDAGPSVITMLKLGGGWRWVELFDASDADYPTLSQAIPKNMRTHNWTLSSPNPVLRRESYFMRHCIGTGPYHAGKPNSKGNGNGNAQRFFSLRGPNNRPHVTIETKGDRIVQIQGVGDRTPDKKYVPAIVAFLNSDLVNLDVSSYITRLGLIVIGDKVFDSKTIEDMSRDNPKELLDLGITKGQLRDLKMFRVGDRVYRMESAPDMSKEMLAQSDLTAEELHQMGYVRKEDGTIKGYDDLSPGDTLAEEIKFNNPLAPIKFADGLTFMGGIDLNGYPGKTFPKNATIHKKLRLSRSEITKFENVTLVDCVVEITSTPVTNLPSGEFKRLSLSDTKVNGVSGIECKDVTIKSTPVGSISKCSFGKCVLQDTNVKTIDCKITDRLEAGKNQKLVAAKIDANGFTLIDLSNTPLERLEGSFKSDNNDSTLELSYTKIKKLPSSITCDVVKLVNSDNLQSIPKGIKVNDIWLSEDSQANVIPVGSMVNSVLIYPKGSGVDSIEILHREGYEPEDDLMKLLSVEEDGDENFVIGEPIPTMEKTEKGKKK